MTWIVSGILLSALLSFVTSCQIKVIQGHEVKKRSNSKNLVWVVSYMFLGQTFVKNAQMTLALFERRKLDQKMKIGKCRNPRKWQKKAFWGIQNGRTEPFPKRAAWNFGRIFNSKCSYTRIPFLLNLNTFLENFQKKTIFWLLFFPVSKIFKKIKIWQCSLMFDAMSKLHVIFFENQSILSLKLYSWRRFTRTLMFDRNRENMTSLWRLLRPIFQSLWKFLWSGYVKLTKEGIFKVWWRYLL